MAPPTFREKFGSGILNHPWWFIPIGAPLQQLPLSLNWKFQISITLPKIEYSANKIGNDYHKRLI